MLKGKLMVKFDLRMVLMEVIVFSGKDENVVSDEVSIGSLTKLGSPCE